MNTVYMGKSGLFKREKALAMARALLNPKCLDVHPDFLMIEPEKGKISVSEAKKIAEFLAYATIEAEQKVIVIDKCHLATDEFQQAILKLLEDGSKKASFIITTEEPLLPTIHSRCNTINEKPWMFERMVSWIEEEGIVKNEMVVNLSGGRPGLYRELIQDEEFTEKVSQLVNNLRDNPCRTLIELGALEEGYYEPDMKEREFLLVNFIENYISTQLLLDEENTKLTMNQMLDVVDACSDERMNMRSRAYGKTENFRFYRTLHSILCGTGC